MRDKGFSGAMIFDAHGANQHNNSNVPNGPMYGSDEWTELYLHALYEAKRLGLELNMIAACSWNAGAYLKRQAGILLNLQFLTRLTMT
jgi:hypothetical protein